MGEAAKISLKAIGMQDTHLLSKDPEDSLFDPKIEQHSNFIKKHKVRNIPTKNAPGWPFGQTIKVQYNPQNMGDFLSNMWIKIKVPRVDGTTDSHAPMIGRHIIKNITMFVDETKIEELTGDWCAMSDLLYTDPSEFSANLGLLNYNSGQYYTNHSITNLSNQYGPTDVLIPISFFFCGYHGKREYKENDSNHAYFPVCAIHKQKITFEISFYKQSFWSSVTDTYSLEYFDIITEEIYVTPDERNFIVSNGYSLLAHTIRKHPDEITEVGKSSVTINLVPNIPVSAIHWTLRNVKWEDEDDPVGAHYTGSGDQDMNYFNRFNFTSEKYGQKKIIDSRQVQDQTDIMKSARFYINDAQLPRISLADNVYYRLYTPFQHRMPVASQLSAIYTYSYALYPKTSQPSGYLDFSQLNSDKTLLSIELYPEYTQNDAYRVIIYYKGYEQFNFSNGFVTKIY